MFSVYPGFLFHNIKTIIYDQENYPSVMLTVALVTNFSFAPAPSAIGHIVVTCLMIFWRHIFFAKGNHAAGGTIVGAITGYWIK